MSHMSQARTQAACLLAHDVHTLRQQAAAPGDRKFEKTFTDWLISCHANLDKRFSFKGMADVEVQVCYPPC
jgi:hypothetical protein